MDASPGVRSARRHAGLAPGDGHGIDSHGVERHGDKRNGLLLAGGEQDVHLAGRWIAAKLVRHPDELVRDAAHGRDNDGDIVAFIAEGLDAIGDVADAVEGADRGAAIFLNDEHGSLRGLNVWWSEVKGSPSAWGGLGSGTRAGGQAFWPRRSYF